MAKKKKATRRKKSPATAPRKPAVQKATAAQPAASTPVIAPAAARDEAWFVRHNSALEGMLGGPYLCEVVEDCGNHCLLVAVDSGIGRRRQEVMVPATDVACLKRDQRRAVLDSLPPDVLTRLAGEYLLDTGASVDQVLAFEFGK